MKPALKSLFALSLLLTLPACAGLRSPYATPAVAAPPDWAHGQAGPVAPAQDAWWRRFNDPRLDALVDRVLARDNNLAAAAITLRRARIQARYAVINPTFGASASDTYSDPLRGPYPATRTATTALTASYEADLFGALAAQSDAARWEARASVQDLESTRLSLIGTTVDLYYQLAYLNGRIAVARKSIDHAQRTLDLVKVQLSAGAVSPLNRAESAQSLASQQAGLHDLIEQKVEAEAALNLLLNGEASSPDDELQALPDGDLPAVDAGLPASLLGRRPDLRAAELRLREALASVDQARLGFYPTLTLTGSLGGTSNALGNLLQNPVGTVGANLALPFLNYGQVKLSVGVSRASYDLAVVNFRQTLYQALTDADNALSARQQYAGQAVDLEESLKQARTVERLNEVLYRAGSIPLQTWLDSQETRRQAETAEAANRLNQFQNYVAIYKALGGDANSQR